MAATMPGSPSDALARVVHDMRSPLTVILGLCDVIARDELPSRARRGLRAIDGDVTRLAEALDGLVGRRGPGAEVADLAAMAAAAGMRFRWAAEERGVTLAVRAAAPVHVAGDPAELARVLDNLIGNALRHCRAGGRVRVRALMRDGWAHLYVRDDGPGVATGDREIIFLPGRRGSRAVGHGQGLGLAIAREIAERHGGVLSLDPVGAGACFRLVLPAASGEGSWSAA
ncbi:MAG: HAMP domain-containing sensor histidine kinase [Miltoncostaeaceae bacterium]